MSGYSAVATGLSGVLLGAMPRLVDVELAAPNLDYLQEVLTGLRNLQGATPEHLNDARNLLKDLKQDQWEEAGHLLFRYIWRAVESNKPISCVMGVIEGFRVFVC